MLADLDCIVGCWECVADDIRHFLYPPALGSWAVDTVAMLCVAGVADMHFGSWVMQ